ncbi:hypothetical protein ABK905_25000 [Acerihabitans sp. KWT182]|uniref:PE domain-containing protein n=1 Tax=Acerihabitans sp. KWT182 TaxID=3157919 RepID=A0AAU7Q967_9GAMM
MTAPVAAPTVVHAINEARRASGEAINQVSNTAIPSVAVPAASAAAITVGLMPSSGQLYLMQVSGLFLALLNAADNFGVELLSDELIPRLAAVQVSDDPVPDMFISLPQ